MFCPEVCDECVEEECVAYSKGVPFMVRNSSNLMSNVFQKNLQIDPFPLVLHVDIGFCKKFGMLLEGDSIMKDLEYVANNSFAESG